MNASESLQQSMFEDPLERRYWIQIWNTLFNSGVPDSWAYRWSLVCMANSGLTALPNRNLVANIGYGDDATHTRSQIVQGKALGLGKLVYPSLIVRDAHADAFTFYRHFGGQLLLQRASIAGRVSHFIRQFARRCARGVR